MLSYRHAFHAGNHADVLKHFVLVQLGRHLAQKDKPFWIVDTHAGAGLYALDAGHGTQLKEYETGIGRLWERDGLPAALADYVDLVRACNPGATRAPATLRVYPGSPWLALQMLRPQDRLRLFELHTSDSTLLRENLKDRHRRVTVAAADGFGALKALLPPPPRRALVLIDPPYEVRDDYARVVTALREDGLPRFATGTYAVWYPQLARAEARQLPDRLRGLPVRNWLNVTLDVRRPSPDGLGMHGSGMFVVNPPWTLYRTLEDVMPCLVRMLGQSEGADFTLDARGD